MSKNSIILKTPYSPDDNLKEKYIKHYNDVIMFMQIVQDIIITIK